MSPRAATSRTPGFIAVAFAATIVTALVPLLFAAGPMPSGGNIRVSTHDIVATDPFAAAADPRDVLQQNEPSVAVHPTDEDVIAVGMNDVRTLALADDAWQGLAVSTNGGTSSDFEALVPGFPGDISPEGLASPVRGNAAASNPWLAFDTIRSPVLCVHRVSTHAAGSTRLRSGEYQRHRSRQVRDERYRRRV